MSRLKEISPASAGIATVEDKSMVKVNFKVLDSNMEMGCCLSKRGFSVGGCVVFFRASVSIFNAKQQRTGRDAKLGL
jgi:hypothetical protein